jgi:hypothetical protein
MLPSQHALAPRTNHDEQRQVLPQIALCEEQFLVGSPNVGALTDACSGSYAVDSNRLSANTRTSPSTVPCAVALSKRPDVEASIIDGNRNIARQYEEASVRQVPPDNHDLPSITDHAVERLPVAGCASKRVVPDGWNGYPPLSAHSTPIGPAPRSRNVRPPGIRIMGIAPEFAHSLRRLLVLDELIAPHVPQRPIIPDIPWFQRSAHSPLRSKIPVTPSSMKRLGALAGTRMSTLDSIGKRHR